MSPSLILCLIFAALICALLFVVARNRRPIIAHLCNIGSGTHENAKSLFADAALTTRYLLVAIGSDSNHCAICAADDIPIGVVPDEVATADIAAVPVAVDLLGISNKTMLMVPSEALSAGEEVFTAADGKIQDLPTVAGTYYSVGYALEVGAADIPCEVLHHSPRKLVVT
jgi:hypothetical protein